MRYKLIIFIFILFWAGMIYRLYYVSITSSLHYKNLAKENVERKQFLIPVRGEITDTNGNLLAMNQIGFSISIQPHMKSNGSRFAVIIDKLVNTFPDLNRSVMLKVYKKSNSFYNHKFIKVVNFIPYSQMMASYPKLSLLPELKIDAETKRYYPYGKYAAHIVGYTGTSNKKDNSKDTVVNKVGKVGKTGLERYYNKVLQGELGHIVSKVTATNKEIEVLEKEEPKDNRNIQLNVDIDLQKMIYDRFRESKEVGVAVVMRTTGEILSAVSYPSYDPNLFVGGISTKAWKKLQNDLSHPFTNKFIHGTYPPGSTIKMGMALAFSKSLEGVLDSNELCTGHIKLGKSNHKFRCWASWGHGYTGLRRSIKESCDVYYYTKSLKVGIDLMAKHLRTFGFGVKTGVDLPREYSGIIPDKAWKFKRYKKPWYRGETVISAIGQGYNLATPLQLARHTILLASSNLVTPYLAKVVDENNTTQTIVPMSFNEKHLKEIRKGMYDVCNAKYGTAYKTMSGLPIIVAGKTGTSQVTSIPQSTKIRLKEEQLAYFHRSHAWITTYAPYKNPQFVVTILVEHGGHGGSTAGPIAADIYKWLNKKKYFKKNKLPVVKSMDTNSTLDLMKKTGA